MTPERQAGATQPGAIPVRFNLESAGYVTLVIEDAAGNRVRNLIAETQLPAGENQVIWDGYDDGVRDTGGNLVRQRVAPGKYGVRGLTHGGIHLSYEFPIYSGGNPPWKTPDKSGGWMADHSVPLGAVFLPAGLSPHGDGKPQMLLSSLVAEAGDAIIFVDETGQRMFGDKSFGWEGGVAVTRDMGTPADPGLFAYALSAREEHVVLRALRKEGGGVDILKIPAETAMPREPVRIGISVAVYNGLAVVSMPADFNWVSMTKSVCIFRKASLSTTKAVSGSPKRTICPSASACGMPRTASSGWRNTARPITAAEAPSIPLIRPAHSTPPSRA